MKNLWLKAASMTAMGGAALSPIATAGRVFAQAADPSVKSKQESPLACNAFALSLRSKGTGTLMNSVQP